MRITAAMVKRAFVNAGADAPSDEIARRIAEALPMAALATGWSEAEVLEIVILNRDGGAIERLFAMVGDGDERPDQG